MRQKKIMSLRLIQSLGIAIKKFIKCIIENKAKNKQIIIFVRFNVKIYQYMEQQMTKSRHNYTCIYQHPAVTAGCVFFGFDVKNIKALFSLDVLPPLTFDHERILRMGISTMQNQYPTME